VRRRLALHTKERIAQPGGPQETVATFAREAHRQVTAELTEHAAGLALPAEIKQFVVELLGPWMMVRYHRYGPDSAPWQQARSFAASFFDGLRPAVSSADEARKQALRARILSRPESARSARKRRLPWPRRCSPRSSGTCRRWTRVTRSFRRQRPKAEAT
jgi:hypothetical protein